MLNKKALSGVLPVGRAGELVLRTLVFVMFFGCLQGLWHLAEDRLAPLWIDTLTVPTSTKIIQTLTPEALARSEGVAITTPQGRLNIRAGCDGIDVLCLLLAAIGAAPLSFGVKAATALVGLFFVFAINLARIVVLFYALRSDLDLFDLLHNTVTPITLVALVALYFRAALHWTSPQHPLLQQRKL
jgi:exosortase/archaeosortase family protein